MGRPLYTTGYDCRHSGRDPSCPCKHPICLLAATITIGRLGVSNANVDRRKIRRAVPAVWSQNATLQVALSRRLSVYRMSGSAPRFSCIFTCAGSTQCPRQLSPLMGTGSSGSKAVFVLFTNRFSYFDNYGAGCAIFRTPAPVRGQAECHYET